jgi:hypothetical protein
MSSYRKMRRQARHARRAGMQPMMVINTGDPLPDLAIVAIARWIRRYRSELAPLGVAWFIAVFGIYVHAALSRWWPVMLTVTTLAAVALGVFGRRIGVGSRAERVYLAVAVAACGTWEAFAAVAGPFTPAASGRAGRRRAGAVGAVVGQPAPARQSPSGAHDSSVAGHRPSNRAYGVRDHVRRRRPVGMASTHTARARPDNRRRDRTHPRDRIRSWHVPGRGPDPPDP